MGADVDRWVIKSGEEARGGGEVDGGPLEGRGIFSSDAVDRAAHLVGAAGSVVVEVTQEERAIGANEKIGGEEELSFFSFLELNEILMFAHLNTAIGEFGKAGHDLFADHASDQVGAFETEDVVLDEDISGG